MSSYDTKAEPESPVTIERFNIRKPRRKVQETIFGKIRAFETITVVEWIYLGVSFAGLITSAGLTIQRIASGDSGTSDFTFAVLLLVTIAFCFYYVVDSMLTERADELMVFIVSNFIVLIYCIANYALQHRSTIKLVRLIVVCILSVILIPVGLYLCYKYVRSNNLIFNTVGAITQLQKGCKIYFLCSSLLKFDVQLQLSMLILVMGAGGSDMDQTQKFILGYGVIFTIIFVITGFVGLCQENRILMTIFFILAICEPGYVAYKFYYAVVYESSDAATYESTFACGCFAIVVWLALMIFTGYYTKYCFYKGLREKMFGFSPNNVTGEPPPLSTESIIDVSDSSRTTEVVQTSFPPSLPSASTSDSLSVITAEVHGAD